MLVSTRGTHFIGTFPQDLGDHFQSMIITGSTKLVFMLMTVPHILYH